MRLLSRVLAIGVAAVLVAGPASGYGVAATTPSAPATGADFHPVAPVRVLDTRSGLGQPSGRRSLLPGGYLTLNLVNDLPAGTTDMTAAVLNVTATNVDAPTYVSVFPGLSLTNTSTMNLVPGETRANLATVGTDNQVEFYSHAANVDLIVDLVGYYTKSGGSELTTTTPTRVLDTRTGTTMGPNTTQVLDLSAQVPADATAVVLNVTALDATDDTFVTVWPDGSPFSGTSSLNLTPGETVPNEVIVPLGPGDKVDLYNHAGAVDVLADLVGYYEPVTTSSFSPLFWPLRALNTTVAADGEVTLDMSGWIPPTATAVVLNLTGTQGTAPTYLTAWADGSTRPGTSNLNLTAGQTAAVQVTVAVGPGGKVDFYNHAGSTQVIADLGGYFAPPAVPCSQGCVTSWGFNEFWSLGTRHDEQNFVATPAPLYGLTNVVSVTPGYAALSDGSVWSWGEDMDNSLANGSDCDICIASAPVRVSGLTDVTQVAAGGLGGYALRSDGTVWAMGGQSTSPTPVAGMTGVTAITPTNGADLYAVRGDGTVLAMGANDSGQLGNGTSCSSGPACASGPVTVSGLTGVVAVTTGGDDGYALRSDGTVWAWGAHAGSLHTGTNSGPSSVPVQVSGVSQVTAIAANGANVYGPEFGYALRSDGTVLAWGDNSQGELGNGTHDTNTDDWSYVPAQVPGLTGVTSVAAGRGDGYAVRSDGSAWAWGWNAEYQLDDGSTSESDLPTPMAGLNGVTEIIGGVQEVFALYRTK